MGDIVYIVLIACGCLVSYRLGRIHGKRIGRDQGWAERERYGNGGRRQWQNRPPGRIKGTERGYWWNYR